MPFAFLPQRLPAGLSDSLGRGLARLGLTANALTLAGFAGTAVAAWLIATEHLLVAGLVFLAASALDLLDGAVARATGQATPFGAVFDAVLDRAGEAAVLAGCAWYFTDRGEQVQAGVTYAALVGGVAVSYIRARGEALGVSLREGLFRRQERVVLLTAALLVDGLAVGVWILAVASNLTALQRFFLLARKLRRTSSY